MRKIMISLTVLLCVAGIALADSIYMRDGSQVQGKFLGYENSYFIFQASNGGQVKYPVQQVSRLVLDRETSSDDTLYRRYPGRGNENTVPSYGTARWESSQPFDVRLQDQWIRSQVQVRRGQRVKVEATGSVTLDGRYSVNPDGRSNSRASSLPMPNQNDGALIAAIGSDEDAPPILIGRQHEFVADRNGPLYFSVNHRETRNTGGAFRVTISVDRSTGSGWGSQRGAAQSNEKVIAVPGNKTWVDTGIDLDNNGTLDVTAEGQITFRRNAAVGPDGDIQLNARDVRYPINDAGVGALIAKIRYSNGTESAPRLIGARNATRIESSEFGRLYLGINDNVVSDNTGSYRVTIRW